MQASINNKSMIGNLSAFNGNNSTFSGSTNGIKTNLKAKFQYF
jgi:hypothetical protein